MSTELDWAYEVLGVKPGVSDRELKTAHRDLAKVWHPDRFGHDPRLQQKAQEKLKEINEAYEQLISRHTRRVAPPPPPPPPRRAQQSPVAAAPARVRRGMGWQLWVAMPVAIFAVVFAFTTKKLLPHREAPVNATEVVESTEQQPATAQDSTRVVRNRTDNNLAPADSTEGDATSQPAPTNEAVVAVPTVTVSIDPASGLLATPTCPVKTRMTYPSGSEPRTHCNIQHVVKTEKETGIKGLAKRIL